MRFSSILGFAIRPRLAAAVFAAAGVVLSAQPASLSLVSTAWPPFTNEPGQPRFALDLVEAAFGRLGMKATTTIVPAREFTPALLGGRFDGSAAAWKDEERERVLLFSQPYLENRLVLVGRRGSDVTAATFTGLAGKRVALVEGYSYGDAIEAGGPVFVRTSREEDSLAQLLAGEVDYTLMDELVVRYLTSHYPKEAQSRLQFGSTPMIVRPLYLAIRRERPDAASIVQRFNSQIRSMMADRTYHRLLHVDWIHADVDGDGVPEFVPRSDRLGTVEPRSAYLVSTPEPAPATSVPTKPGFYVGGNIYRDWASVPKSYKVPETEPGRSTASIFTFRW